MIKRTRFIYNPSAGRETLRRKLPDILQRLERGGYETSTIATQQTGDARRAATEAAQRGFDVVIAAGGDGTLNEVADGLAQWERRPILGIMPLGTTNDVARALGIPRVWEEAINVIVAGHVQAIDVGVMNKQLFLNVVGGGSLTELTYEAPSKLKTLLGQLAYYIKGFEKLPTLHPTPMRLHAAEMQINEELMLFLVANTRSIGGFHKLLPTALWDDGYLDVLCLRKCNLADFVRLVSRVIRGEEVHDELLIHFRTKHVEVSSPKPVRLNIDGEYGGDLPCRIHVLPQHLHVFMAKTALLHGKE
jgi:diacylglycerol kinase (ATP)